MANDYTGSYTGIAKGEQISAADMTAALNKMEKVANKKDVVNNSSEEFPSSKAVYELVCPGIIYPYAGATAPDGWAICDGRSVSRTTYHKLFESIGTTWGGNGNPNFNLPDLRGATIRGVGTTTPGLYKDTINGVTTNAQQVSVYLAEAVNDAIRNIYGQAEPWKLECTYHTGAFRAIGSQGVTIPNGNSLREYGINLDASRIVPTANENRVKARGVNFIIKLV